VLKLILYMGLTSVGLIGALFSPLIGAVACLSAYFLYPSAISMDTGDFRFQLWTTLAFVVGLLLHRPERVSPVGHEGILLKLLWGVLAVFALSAGWAVVDSQIALDTSWDLCKTIILASALVLAVRSENDMSVLITTCLVGVLHAGFLHTFGARLGYIQEWRDREYGVMVESQSAVMVLFIPLLVLVGMSGSRTQRWLAWCALPFALNSVIKSYQRAAFVGLLVDAAALLFFLPWRVTRRILPAALILTGLFAIRLAPQDYWWKMNTIEVSPKDGSAQSRYVLAQASLEMFRDFPFGVGYKNYQFVSPRYLDASYLTDGKRSSHNSFFTVLCEGGPIAFILWGSAFCYAVLLLRRIRRKASPAASLSQVAIYAMGIEVGLYGWLAMGLFHDVHDLDPAYWYLAFVIILVRLSGRAVATESRAEEIVSEPLRIPVAAG
jgi:hypothetical protein